MNDRFYTYHLKILNSLTDKCLDILLDNMINIDGIRYVSMNSTNTLATVCCNKNIHTLIAEINTVGLIVQEVKKYSPNMRIYYY